ncbi:MAG TPA: OmpA family protein [Candidatus Polarisedimenticolaceae bacterium]|nr:OmpA family protein [Candidatus Polarisedimenticolaceae bacterium]
MFKRMGWTVAGVAALALVASTGCVSKKVWKQNVAETDTRMKGVESGLETQEKRTTDLARETDGRITEVKGTAEKAVELGTTALSKAESAEKAARGKVLWTTTLSDDSVKFTFDGEKVPTEAQAILDDLASKVKGMDKGVYLEIEGHTDNIGSEDYNEHLGELRAEAVRNYLAEKAGIPLHIMNVISFGESKPVAENNTREGRSKNRRVVVRVLE